MLRIVARGALADQLATYDGVAPTVATPGLTRHGVVDASAAEWFRQERPDSRVAARPAGYHGINASTSLPADSYDRACEAVLTMAVHREAGLLTAMPPAANGRVREGDTVVVGVPLGPLALVVPCRVVWVAEDGFGYATLPGHPENGEEAFRVRQLAGGTVDYSVSGYSRSAGLARLGGPVARFAASRTVAGYLAAMRRLTA